MNSRGPQPATACPDAWSKSREAVLDCLGADATLGLSAAEAAERLERFGRNELRAREPRPLLGILVDQFRSVVILLLVAASAVAFLFADALQGMAILAVVFINAGIGFLTEWRAVRSMEALDELGRVETVVVRDGDARRIRAEELVPGDIVLREGGDVVTADMRLVESASIEADESALTGESLPVSKTIEPLAADTPLMERRNMLFKGTSVTRGAGRAVVVATGIGTELGRISELVKAAEPQETPLEKRLDQMAGRLVRLVIGVAVVLAVAGVVVGEDTVLAIEVAIALAVAAIPEGLPVVATIALARGLWRMARRNALISRLSAVETLGATSVILTDKTGTLTENRMRVVAAEVAGRSLELPCRCDDDEVLRELLAVAALCSNAELADAENEDDNDVGDPTEIALLEAARDAGIERATLLESAPEIAEFAFDPAAKLMGTLHARGGTRYFAVKGAPESILERATLELTDEGPAYFDDQRRHAWLARAHALGARGLRTLAIAVRRDVEDDAPGFEALELLGLVGLEDPARAGVSRAIEACREAGIRVIMLTGDHPATACKIATDVGILPADAPAGASIRGEDLDEDRLDESAPKVAAASVFSRVTPAQKLALIDFYQRRNNVVAMTGDGVNDAPALKKADIGVAMGIRGTAVAKEASAMVLQDDEFETIVEAVRQGRAIYENIRKFVVYLLSCNMSEVLIVSLATVVGAPLPLLPLQILFLNLVTDVFPALALGVGEGARSLMDEAPRRADEPILTQPHWISILVYGLLISAAVLSAMALAVFALGYESDAAVTVSFCTLALAQVWHVLNMRGPQSGAVRNEITRNPWVWAAVVLCVALILGALYLPPVAAILSLSAPGAGAWAVIVVMSLLPVCLGPLVRAFGARFSR
jgi:Ca2+-transporting ATPase